MDVVLHDMVSAGLGSAGSMVDSTILKISSDLNDSLKSLGGVGRGASLQRSRADCMHE